MPALTTVAVLGPLQVRCDGTDPPPELLWRKHLATALVLWIERPRPVSRDRLLALLWADRPEAAARHSLNEALRVIRRACGTESLASTATTVAWVGPVTLDSDEWAQRVLTDPVAAAALVRGPWCEGLTVPGASGWEDWATGHRDRWRGPMVECLVRAAGMHSDAGDTTTAFALAERAHRIHPWSDDAVLAIVRTRALVGDRAGALAIGREHERRLHEELGATIGTPLATLLGRLRSGVDSDRRREVLVAGAVHDAAPPLLHRAELLTAAVETLRIGRSVSGAATVVWSGPTGSGRSRLLDESCARLRVDGVPVAIVRALPGDGVTPEAGVDALADALLSTLPGLGGGDPVAIATLAARRPAWRERFPAHLEDPPLPVEAALLSVLRAAADEGAIAVAIDDLDRFHAEAIDAVAGLVRALAEMPVRFVFTVHTDRDVAPVAAFCRVVGRELGGAVLTVPSLDPALALALVEWALPAWTVAAQERLTRRLLAEAGGSTFIAVTLLEALRDGFALPTQAEVTWPAPDRTFDATFPGNAPPTLTLALRHAFHQLTEVERTVLQCLAAGVAPMPTARTVEALDRLERTRWIVSDVRGYQIPAAAVRRFVLEDSLTPGQLRRLRDGVPHA